MGLIIAIYKVASKYLHTFEHTLSVLFFFFIFFSLFSFPYPSHSLHTSPTFHVHFPIFIPTPTTPPLFLPSFSSAPLSSRTFVSFPLQLRFSTPALFSHPLFADTRFCSMSAFLYAHSSLRLLFFSVSTLSLHSLDFFAPSLSCRCI